MLPAQPTPSTGHHRYTTVEHKRVHRVHRSSPRNALPGPPGSEHPTQIGPYVRHLPIGRDPRKDTWDPDRSGLPPLTVVPLWPAPKGPGRERGGRTDARGRTTPAPNAPARAAARAHVNWLRTGTQ
uniref:Uncharacterized protein n=1 Tax=Streptomyces avermitilis TaxID=33903 RepID=A0A499V3Z8_STRAX|nr:hypothetical protein SAVMC3_08410 [Streptomyces avermitilis]